ncbi:MAG: hypothetical protein AB1721_02560 [Patescibacteria group bacterium]
MPINFHPEIESLNQEFQQRIKSAEGPLTPEKEKEVLKQVIAEKFQAQPQTQSAQPVQTQPIQTPADDNKNAEEIQEAINSLIEITFNRGLYEGIKQARQTHNAFLIDQYHDELVNRFYQELKAQKK